jgi:hypothetical protein
MRKILYKDFTSGFTECVPNDHVSLIHPGTSVETVSVIASWLMDQLWPIVFAT